jgi:hypothetical protein
MHTYHDVARLTTGDRACEISPTIAPKRKTLAAEFGIASVDERLSSLLLLRIILALLLAGCGGSGSTETAMATTQTTPPPASTALFLPLAGRVAGAPRRHGGSVGGQVGGCPVLLLELVGECHSVLPSVCRLGPNDTVSVSQGR